MVESRSFVRDEALRWLGEAKWGYETALILRRERGYSAAAFYAHQPAEKTANTLPYHVNEAPWDCSVRVFLERHLAKTGADADPELLSCSRGLDIHYIPSQCPNTRPAGTPHEVCDGNVARAALEASRKILDFARQAVGDGRG